MTYLLLQTFLLLLSAYFLGAFLACLTKRTITQRARLAAVATAARASAAPAARPAASLVAARPRSIDPVQPKIDILPRPKPKPAPAISSLDTTRFDRALTGPDPNAGMPRKMIVEIRPAILKSPTGPAQALKPKPQPAPAPAKAAPAQAAAAPVQPAPQPKPAAAPVQQTAAPAKPAPAAAPVQTATSVPSMGASAGAAAATAAAAAAVAAARAAAASAVVVPRYVTPAPAPAPVAKPAEPPRPAAPASAAVPSVPTAAPAAPPLSAAPQPAAGSDDFQRIRAIDADTERRLRGLGVRLFDDIARWTPADINRVDQALGLTGRIDREQWIEQAQILAKGGETYYSRNRASAARGATPVLPQAPAPAATPTAAPAPAAAQTPAPSAVAKPAETAPKPAASAAPVPVAPQGKSVAEMATAAAAAIAAASASVTRGVRPIEPISPFSRADPNVSMPAKLSDAIKDKEVKSTTPPTVQTDAGVAKPPRSDDRTDDLKRIRGVGVLIEKRLNALGITTYDAIANWTSGDIDRISQTLDFKGRIERENWVEQARILSSGGQTEFSRRVDRGDVETSKDPEAT